MANRADVSLRREAVQDLRKKGRKVKAIARELGVSQETVKRDLKTAQTSGKKGSLLSIWGKDPGVVKTGRYAGLRACERGCGNYVTPDIRICGNCRVGWEATAVTPIVIPDRPLSWPEDEQAIYRLLGVNP